MHLAHLSKSKGRGNATRVANAYMSGKHALYWKEKGRRYVPTKDEVSSGCFSCPKCSGKLEPATYKKHTKLMACRECLFLIKRSDILDSLDPAEKAEVEELGCVGPDPDEALSTKSALIKMGSEIPELRPHLRPILDALHPSRTRTSSEKAAREWLHLDRVLTSWGKQLKQRLTTDDIQIDVSVWSEGVYSSYHPLRWKISVYRKSGSERLDSFEFEITGDAQNPFDGVYLQYDRVGKTGRSFHRRHKDIRDWTPRKVINTLADWL